MEVGCFKCFICMDSLDEQNAFAGLQNFFFFFFLIVNKCLSLPLNESLQSEIKQIQKTSNTVQNIACITAIADKKLISASCLFAVFSLVLIK